MDKKEARKILGVTKETSRNDIERKYSILLKKHRAASMPAETADEDYQNEGAAVTAVTRNVPATEEYTFDQVTEAYNVLMGYEVRIKEQPPSKMAPLLKKAGIDEKKARNFFYYYKFYILGALLLAIVLFYGIRSFVNRVEPDFNIAFLGSFSYYEAADKLSDSIKEKIPAIKEPGIDGAFLTTANLSDNQQLADGQQPTDGQQPAKSGQITGQEQYAMEMKAMVLITAGDIDVFIVDRDRYFQYARQGVFLSLDDIAPSLGADLDKNKELITKIEETDPFETGGTNNQSSGSGTGTVESTAEGDPGEEVQAHLYGIDVTNSKVLKETGVIGPDKIAAICAGSKRIDKAEEFIKFLMK